MTPLINLIKDKYPLPRWATIIELSDGTGYSKRQQIDAAVFSCWPSDGLYRIAFEIKSHRSDWLRELNQPAKRKWVEEEFHETYFLCERDVVKEAEVPEGWGLMLPTKKRDKLRIIIRPRFREAPEWSIISLAAIRALATGLNLMQVKTFDLDGETITAEQLQDIVGEMTKLERKFLTDERNGLIEMRSQISKQLTDLERPLVQLWMKATGKSWGWDQVAKAMTAETIQEWYDQMRARAIESVEKEINKAAGAMAQLKDTLDALKT